MAFEDFYKESDRAARRWWKCFGLAFLLLIGYWTFGYLALPAEDSSRPPTEVAADPAPLSEEDLRRRVDALCAGLPQPEKVSFVSKEISAPEKRSAVAVYHFQTARDFGEIAPAFSIWFNSNDWKPDPNTEMLFNKGRQTVLIRGGKFYSGYDIYCYENDARVSFGIYD